MSAQPKRSIGSLVRALALTASSEEELLADVREAMARTPDEIRARRFAGWLNGTNVRTWDYVHEGALDAGYSAEESRSIADAMAGAPESQVDEQSEDLLAALTDFSLVGDR